MSITVNTNMSSIIAQRSLYKATNKMNTALERLSTGLRINSSKDDAAGSAISTKLEYKMSSYNVAKDNAQMGQSMLDTANGTLSNINSMLQRMRDLSEQAANGTYGEDERKAMQAEIDGLTEEIYRIKNTTEFNGKKILGEEEIETKQQVSYTAPTISMSEINTVDDLKALDKSEIIGISTAEDLAKLSELTKNSKETKPKNNITKGRTFVLTSDIDLSKYNNFQPIGTIDINNGKDLSKIFQGVFDGNGYTISNLKINEPTQEALGLFGIALESEIKNINLENVNITGFKNTGGLVGALRENSKVSNCSVSGIISGTYRGTEASMGNTGGFVGFAYKSTIENCSANVKVHGGRFTGGFVGNTSETNFENCSTEGQVVGENIGTGGFVGVYNTANSFLIKNCYASTRITNNGISAGSFIGSYMNSGSLESNTFDKTKSTLPAIGSGLTETSEQIKGEYLKNSISCKTNLQVGINSDYNSVISVDTGFSLDNFKVSVLNEYSARNSLDKIDAMMSKITDKLTNIGATQNRLESVMEFQEVQCNALTSANSLIKDADIAKESANYVKNQILQNVTSTLLATANQNPSVALQLL